MFFDSKWPHSSPASAQEAPLLDAVGAADVERGAPPPRTSFCRGRSFSGSSSYMGSASFTDIAERVVDRGENAGGVTSGAQLCGLALRSLGALGVVYGDIGTSPLYTLSSVYGKDELPDKDDLIGAASCLVWTVTLVVVLKYILIIIQADHNGEGGIFALLLMMPPPLGWPLGVLAVMGSSMLIGDGMVTPAMSVLSAFEGLDSGPFHGFGLTPFIVPCTILCLVLLFGVQPLGIGKIGRAFGPIMVVYFLAIGIIGFSNIAQSGRWEIFGALSPMWVLRFFSSGRFRGWPAFWQLGTFVLSVTGAEALYADLGHFGRTPILISWFGLVYPSLVLCYLGQAAFLIDHPDLVSSAFWDSVPHSIYIPMMALVTCSTIIASQALIAGCYSLINQAVALGFFPRVKTVHTDSINKGQIFIPEVAWMLCIGTLFMVLYFRHSAAMAGAYGIAVTGTFSMTTLLFAFVTRRAWGWSWVTTFAVTLPILCLDLSFFVANAPKVLDGGYVPLLVGLVLTVLMLTWRWGQQQVEAAAAARWVGATEDGSTNLTDGCFVWLLRSGGFPQKQMDVAGVFLLETPLRQAALKDPMCTSALLRFVARAVWSLTTATASLPRVCVLLAIDFCDQPFIPDGERSEVCKLSIPCLGSSMAHVHLRVGFAETLADLSVHDLMKSIVADLAAGLPQQSLCNVMPIRYFIDQYAYQAGASSSWIRRCFVGIWRLMNACCRSTASFLDLPLDMLVHVGGVIEL